jgi:DNA-directed RNA polymerase III subunit RPC8
MSPYFSTRQPAHLTSDITKGLFFWYSDDEEKALSPEQLLSTKVAQRLYIDVGQPIRFRVETIEWQDIKPDPPTIHEPGTDLRTVGEPEKKAKNPYESAGFRILVSFGTVFRNVFSARGEGIIEGGHGLLG